MKTIDFDSIDLNSDEFLVAFQKIIVKIQEEVVEEIYGLVNNSEVEFEKIRRMFWGECEKLIELDNSNAVSSRENSSTENEISRYGLSSALASIGYAGVLLEEGDVFGSLQCINTAGYAFGVYKGMTSANSLYELKKRLIAKNAANKRHEPGNKIKNQVIQEYKDNKSSYKSKDNAAEKLSTKYEMAFSTVRSWLRNQ